MRDPHGGFYFGGSPSSVKVGVKHKNAGGEQGTMADQDQVFAKCAWRLIPFIMLLYVVNYIDRVNVAFAALTMNKDVGLSDTVFGFGGAMFFIGYLIFQVPANLMLEKFGARRWIFLILAVWGVISSANAFTAGEYSYYGLRFFLGVAEAGFFPGMLLYMTYWFPQSYRSRFIGIFMAAIPVANTIGGPISTTILQYMDGLAGLHGWQWMFILEGLPAITCAILALFLLPDRPLAARWLSAEEKAYVWQRLAKENISSDHYSLWPALLDYRVWAIGLVLLGNQVGLYGVQFWMPLMVQAMGFSTFQNGFVVAVPFGFATIAMIWWGIRSDRKHERIWHVASSLLLAAGGLIAASLFDNAYVVMFFLTLAMCGTLSYNGPFFSLPSTFLAGTAAAGGLGLVNTIGSFGRLVASPLVAALKVQSGGYASGMVAMGACELMAAILVLVLGRVMAQRKLALEAKSGSSA
jgi:ACS family tartrate transporter-like MFS transporter